MLVDIAYNIRGFVHYNEISHKGPVNPKSLYNIGDVIHVKAKEYGS